MTLPCSGPWAARPAGASRARARWHRVCGDTKGHGCFDKLEAKQKPEKLVRDFVAAWTKVMNLDRFDVA